MDELPMVLGVGALVLVVSVVAVRVSIRLGFPSLLLYLGIGVVLGEAGFGIRFDNPALTQSLGLAALVLILTEGGLTTRWSAVKPSLGPGILLSTVAVVISIAVTGAALHWLLGLDWRLALLWGAVLASTDAAAVFSVLRTAGVGKRLVGALELESGINDAPAYIAVVVLASGEAVDWSLPLLVVYELLTGLVLGLAFGWLGAQALRRAALPATGLYPLATVAVCVLAYSSGQLAHASGLLATYVAGLVLGNSKLPHRSDTLSFAEGLGWLAQIGLFVLLGLFASPTRLLEALIPGLVAGAVVLLLARPLSVVVSLLPF
ncbi:potassium/proton antiporter, partial [Amycolatopsis sp. NPDC000673]|uniref:potassium/proton antiporter n=1 Tax=Amycolatopsis sp. NPDC000673 TaxID=3154267 RepID=UPI0033192217